jgi:Phage Head-Tail Attachment
MAFVEDLSPFFSEEDFAVAATLNGAAVTGIFDAPYIEPIGNYVAGTAPMFTLPTTSASAAAQGQTLVIGATTYKVAGVEPDGTGITTLRLEAQ